MSKITTFQLEQTAQIDAALERTEEGRFYHWTRSTLVQVDGRIHEVALNIFERIYQALLSLVGSDYLSSLFEGKTVKQLDRETVRKNTNLITAFKADFDEGFDARIRDMPHDHAVEQTAKPVNPDAVPTSSSVSDGASSEEPIISDDESEGPAADPTASDDDSVADTEPDPAAVDASSATSEGPNITDDEGEEPAADPTASDDDSVADTEPDPAVVGASSATSTVDTDPAADADPVVQPEPAVLEPPAVPKWKPTTKMERLIDDTHSSVTELHALAVKFEKYYATGVEEETFDRIAKDICSTSQLDPLGNIVATFVYLKITSDRRAPSYISTPASRRDSYYYFDHKGSNAVLFDQNFAKKIADQLSHSKISIPEIEDNEKLQGSISSVVGKINKQLFEHLLARLIAEDIFGVTQPTIKVSIEDGTIEALNFLKRNDRIVDYRTTEGNAIVYVHIRSSESP